MEQADPEEANCNLPATNQYFHECEKPEDTNTETLRQSDVTEERVHSVLEPRHQSTPIWAILQGLGGECDSISGKKSQPDTSELRVTSLPVSFSRDPKGLKKDKFASTDVDIDQLKQNNKKLRLKVKYMENLGVLVTDFKQENQNLAQENQLLRKRLQELEEMTSKRKSRDNDNKSPLCGEEDRHSLPGSSEDYDDSPFELILSNSNADKHHYASVNEQSSSHTTADGSVSTVSSCIPSRELEIPTQADDRSAPTEQDNDRNVDASTRSAPENLPESSSSPVPDVNSHDTEVKETTDAEEINKVTSLFLSEANGDHSNSRRMTSSNGDVSNATSSHRIAMPKYDHQADVLTNENQAFNAQIRHLEEMVGLRHHSSDDVSINNSEPSVTSQFTKLAAVFASLAQRVVQSQKKARNSQAFCDALMAENEKTKMLLKQSNQQVETLKSENEQMKENITCPATSSSIVPRTVSDLKQTTDANNNAESTLILKLQARVKKLETQRAEILRVNKCWDTQYRSLKQELDRRARESECVERSQDHDVPCSSKSQHYEQKRRRDVELLLATAKREIHAHIEEKSDLARSYASAHAQCQNLKREIAHLKDAQRKMKSDKSCLEAENQRLNQALEAAYSIHERRSVSLPSGVVLHSSGERNRDDRYNLLSCAPLPPTPEAREPTNGDQPNSNAVLEDLRTQVEVLQEQVKIYREDFETERRDREKSQGEKQRLDESLTRARHEVQALSQQVRTHEQDFRQERRDKERLQRQLQWVQNNGREPTSARNRDRYHGDIHDPPAYYAHRFTGSEDTNVFNRTSTRRRSRPTPPQYPGGRSNRPDWFPPENVEGEAILSYPPDDAAERPY